MLFEMLFYLLLGLLLAAPVWYVLRRLGRRLGWRAMRLRYLQPYVHNQTSTNAMSAASWGKKST